MQPDQKVMLDLLEKQRQQQLYLNRILKIVYSITAFLLAVICANLNWQSTLGTFFILVLAFYAVGIKRMNPYLWLSIIALYCCIDMYLSYATFQLPALGRQMGTMLTFTAIVGFSRPYIDQWYFKSQP